MLDTDTNAKGPQKGHFITLSFLGDTIHAVVEQVDTGVTNRSATIRLRVLGSTHDKLTKGTPFRIVSWYDEMPVLMQGL